jgi:M6 family metalloprotease-like protein
MMKQLLLLCLARGLYKQQQRIMTSKHTMQELDTLFNGLNGSVRDIYQKNSYGQLTINSVFTGWIQLNITEAQAANGRLGMSCCSLQNAIRSALDIAQAQGIAFSGLDQNRDGRIDMISILHSGYAAEWGGDDYTSRIWYAIVNPAAPARPSVHHHGLCHPAVGSLFFTPDLCRSHKWRLRQPWVSADGVTVEVYSIGPALWSSEGTEMGHVGVIAHELGHFLGMSLDVDVPYRPLLSCNVIVICHTDTLAVVA